MCHQPQTTDPDTGNTLDMKVFVHKLHMGSQLPSVVAGTPYQIIGFNQAVSDWSTVVLPSDPRRCAFCHEPTKVTGATQADAWMKNPNRAACGSCHDDVNFATGKNHVDLPQVSDAHVLAVPHSAGRTGIRRFDYRRPHGTHRIADQARPRFHLS